MEKDTISERQAALEFVQFAMKGIDTTWPHIVDSFAKAYEGAFKIDAPDDAKLAYLVAVIAVSLEYVEENYGEECADRVTGHFLEAFQTVGNDGPFASELADCREKVKASAVQYVQNPDNNPFELLAVHLLHRWLGNRIRNFYLKEETGTGKIIDPLIAAHVNVLLTPYLGYWKKISETHELVAVS